MTQDEFDNFWDGIERLSEEGVKDDFDKPMTELIDPRILVRSADAAVRAMGRWALYGAEEDLYEALANTGFTYWDLAAVLTHGAQKYSPHNWRLGLNWSRMYAAALRHLFRRGQADEDSGEPHEACAACEIMFLIVSQAKGLGTDDMASALGDYVGMP